MDIEDFHQKFGLEQKEAKLTVHPEQLTHEEWQLRHTRLLEEIAECDEAFHDKKDHEYLDGLVDLVYIALGTAYRRGWDFAAAWNRVHDANMKKERGEEHTSKYGSSFDIVKPKGWVAPTMKDLV